MKPLSERMRIREKQADIINGEDSPFITMDRRVWLDYAGEVAQSEFRIAELKAELQNAYGKWD